MSSFIRFKTLRRDGDELRRRADRVGRALAASQAREAALREALEPFVKEFEARREAYIRRYPRHPAVGARNFDSMPDEWDMEGSIFPMGVFRRARQALASATPEKSDDR